VGDFRKFAGSDDAQMETVGTGAHQTWRRSTAKIENLAGSPLAAAATADDVFAIAAASQSALHVIE
jgi:hypothetical protein